MPLDKYTQTFTRGFKPNAYLVGDSHQNTIIDGRNVWIMPTGRAVSAAGIGNSIGQGGLYMYLVNNEIGFTSQGSVIAYMGGSFFYVGNNIRVGSSLNVSTTNGMIGFQLSSGQQFIAGLTPAPTPGIALVPLPATGKVTGSVAVKLTRRRTATGAEGNGSPSSPAVTGNQSKIRISIPAAATGQDAWGLYATFTGFGLEGPFYFLRQLIVGVDVPVGGGIVDTDWYNSELSQIQPPTNHFPPFPCSFVGSIDNIIIAFGVLGTGIQPSIPGDPESYPQSSILLTNPPENIGLIITRLLENELIFATENSVQSVVATGQAKFPILLRGRWGVSGVQSRHGICPVESDLYLYSGQGLTRILAGNGEPDTTFAIDVQQYVKELNIDPANVVVGYDQRYQHVVYFLGEALIALVYNRQSNNWSPPLTLPGWAQSALTVRGILHVTLDVSGSNLYRWESGSGGSYYLIHDWMDAPGGISALDRKTHLGLRQIMNSKGSATQVDVYVDFDLTTPILTITNPAGQLANIDWNTEKSGYIYRQMAAKISGTGKNHELVAIVYDFNHISNVRF